MSLQLLGQMCTPGVCPFRQRGGGGGGCGERERWTRRCVELWANGRGPGECLVVHQVKDHREGQLELAFEAMVKNTDFRVLLR